MVQNEKPLCVGVISRDYLRRQLITEVLNHLGLPYELVEKQDHKFPCIILVGASGEDYKLARDYCDNENDIIDAAHEIPLEIILRALCGYHPRSDRKLTFPIINEYEDKLMSLIKKKFFDQQLPLVRKWFWPNFSKACCVLTHDVDSLYSRTRIWEERNKVINLIKLYTDIIFRRNYGDNIAEIMQKEKSASVRSSFYFLNDDDRFQERIAYYIREMQNEGFEVGCHGSEGSFCDSYVLKEEKSNLEKNLGKRVIGIRQHNLLFNAPKTWRCQQEAQFKYDTSFAYIEEFGFRSGICFPYHPIDHLTGEKFDLLEIPLAFMDTSVLFFKQMNFNDSWQVLMELTENVERFNGCLVTNFHNVYQNKRTFPQVERLYSAFINFIKTKKYWITTAEGCYYWWTERERNQLDVWFKDNSIIDGTSSFPFPLIIERYKQHAQFVNVNGLSFHQKEI